MNHTLVTILGRSRDTGYRKTAYRFPDGTRDETAFFGLALARRLRPDGIVILGTRGSRWSVLVEHLAGEGDEEEARLELIEAEAGQTVDRPLLERVTSLMKRGVGCDVRPRLIPFGADAEEQYAILREVAEAVPNGAVSFDLTHGFRHLGMVGFLSAFMLERIRNLHVRELWYGALDMTREGVTPVLKLDGPVRVLRWMDALDRFDATGDYGVFAPLSIEDGAPADKANCLRKAAFFERALNVQDAASQIRTFLPVLDNPLGGASGLFQRQLAERLRWAKEDRLSERRRQLALQYLDRGDFVRAAMFGREACVALVCEERGVPTVDYSKSKAAVDEFDREIRESRHPDRRVSAWKDLTALRNALAHGSRPHRLHHRSMLREPARLEQALRAALDGFFG